MVCGDFKDLDGRTFADKLRDKAFNNETSTPLVQWSRISVEV